MYFIYFASVIKRDTDNKHNNTDIIIIYKLKPTKAMKNWYNSGTIM